MAVESWAGGCQCGAHLTFKSVKRISVSMGLKRVNPSLIYLGICSHRKPKAIQPMITKNTILSG